MFAPQAQSNVLAAEESVLEHGLDGTLVQELVDASQYLPSLLPMHRLVPHIQSSVFAEVPSLTEHNGPRQHRHTASALLQ